MSQIFDALHQSAADRAGNGSHDFSAAKELLQVVERRGSSSTRVEQPAPQVSRQQLWELPSVTIRPAASNKLVCFTEPDGLGAEKFRFLATRLRHMQQKRPLKRMVITSSVPGEGKSMIAANLACALAGNKQQVLLLEGDLRRPTLGAQLGLAGLPGISERLQADVSDTDNIYRLDGWALCVVLAGAVQTNSLELMESSKLSAFMDRVSASFDWVIIDSPPVLPLADTSIWTRLADAVLLVTRPGITSKKQLQRALEAVEQTKLLGAVLNGSTEAATSSYYYQYASRGGGLQAPTPAAK